MSVAFLDVLNEILSSDAERLLIRITKSTCFTVVMFQVLKRTKMNKILQNCTQNCCYDVDNLSQNAKRRTTPKRQLVDWPFTDGLLHLFINYILTVRTEKVDYCQKRSVQEG